MVPVVHPSARFVVTGPSGWIGQAMLARLAAATGSRLGGRVTAFASSARRMALPWGEQIDVRALDTITADDVRDAHVIHLAYLTKEKADLLGERRFMDGNLAIDDALASAIAAAAPASLFVASSGAASLAAAGRDYHPYGMAKLRQEARFLEWGGKAGVPVIAGRIFNIAGPHINKVRSYAISNFAVQARESGTIAIEATVPVFRSFLHVNDLCDLVIAAALNRVQRTGPIDLCGAETVEMEDLASLVADASGGATVHRAALGYGSSSAYLGDYTDTKLLAMELGIALSPLRKQVEDTIDWLRADKPETGAGQREKVA